MPSSYLYLLVPATVSDNCSTLISPQLDQPVVLVRDLSQLREAISQQPDGYLLVVRLQAGVQLFQTEQVSVYRQDISVLLSNTHRVADGDKLYNRFYADHQNTVDSSVFDRVGFYYLDSGRDVGTFIIGDRRLEALQVQDYERWKAETGNSAELKIYSFEPQIY